MTMKNYIKSLFVAVALFATSLVAQAQNVQSFALTNAVTNLLFTSGLNISSLRVVQGAGASAGTVRFYDNDVAANTYTNAAYISYTTIRTNLASVSTNSFGELQTNNYLGQWTYAVTNAANTNLLPTVAVSATTPNTSWETSANRTTVKGLVAVPDTTNLTLIVEYYNSLP